AILHDHFDVEILLIGRQHLGVERVVRHFADVDDVDGLRRIRYVPVQARHRRLRIRPEALHDAALRFVHAVEPGQRPAGDEQADEQPDARAGGARGAAAIAAAAPAAAEYRGELALPVLHDAIEVVGRTAILVPTVLPVIRVVPGHVLLYR